MSQVKCTRSTPALKAAAIAVKAAFWASLPRSINLGAAVMAIMTKITMTKISSMRVKPLFLVIFDLR